MRARCSLGLLLALSGCRDRSAVKKDPTPDPPHAAADAGVERLQHVWSKLYTSPNDRLPRDLAVDGAGNAIVVGRFTGKVDFGSGAIESSGSSDAFVVSVSPKGETRWARALGGSLWDEAFAAAVAPDGTVLVAGDLGGDADLGTGKIGKGVSNAPFLAAIAADGKTLWARAFSGGGEIKGVAVAPNGELQVVGRDLVSGPCKGTADVSIARLTATGDPKWTLCTDSVGYGYAQRVALDRAGDVFACGTFRSHFSIGGLAMVPAGGASAPSSSADQLFVAKLSGKDGAIEWGSAGFGDGASCLAIASTPGKDGKSGGVAIGGYYAGAVSFGATKLPVIGYRDGFVASFTADGALRFATAIGDASSGDGVFGLLYGDGGELLVAGEAGAAGKLAGVAAEKDGAYVAGLDVDGKLRWARRFVGGTPVGLARASDGALTLAGDTFTTGDSPGSIDLGGGLINPAPPEKGASHFDVFVARLSP